MRHISTAILRNAYVFAVVCIAAATAVFVLGRSHFVRWQWALLYLFIVVLVAGVSGVRPALLAAVLAFFAWNYFFLPPFHTFWVDAPRDWLSLFAFLAVAVVMGIQTGRLREREAQTRARERELSLLNEFSAHLVSESTTSDMAAALVREVRRAVGARSASLLVLDSTDQPVPTQPEASDVMDVVAIERAKWAVAEGKAIGLPVPQKPSLSAVWPATAAPGEAPDGAAGEVYLPLATASGRQGLLYVAERADSQPYALRDARLMLALANQAAAFLERKQLESVAVQADALRQADKLKTTLVSSVSHELKTPLASITATITNLLEQDVDLDPARLRTELEAVREDLQRLNNSIGALLDLSRLESDAWEARRELYEIGEIVGTAVSRIPQKDRGRLSFEMPDDLPMINVDFLQWARVLQNLLENALAYSPEGSPVRIGASASEGAVTMWVEDEGPGISEQDRERVFDKFYRGEAAAKVPSGTGLGLAVSREIVRHYGGRIWVEDAQPHGARIVVSLPAEA